MGPRSIDRGTLIAPSRPARPSRASMGPRSIDRGTIVSAVLLSTMKSASMGPRSIDRGTDRYRLARYVVFALQWGRDRSIAELDSLTFRSGQPGSFNGAAIDRSRN